MANGLQTLNIGGGQREFWLGSPNRLVQAPTVTGEQQGALSQLLQQALGGIQNPSAGFEPIAQQARTQFSQQTIPSILERFSGLGAQRSSALGQQLGAAGTGLEQGLASQQAQFGQQNLGQLLQMLQLALRPQFENIYQPGSGGALGELGKAGLGALGSGLGMYLGSKPLTSAINALSAGGQ